MNIFKDHYLEDRGDNWWREIILAHSDWINWMYDADWLYFSGPPPSDAVVAAML